MDATAAEAAGAARFRDSTARLRSAWRALVPNTCLVRVVEQYPDHIQQIRALKLGDAKVRATVLRGLQVDQAASAHHFLGNSENAVKTQVWCVVATCMLIAIVKKELQLDASLYTCLQILSVSAFEKTQLSCALQADGTELEIPNAPNQLNLFNGGVKSEVQRLIQDKTASPLLTFKPR